MRPIATPEYIEAFNDGVTETLRQLRERFEISAEMNEWIAEIEEGLPRE